MPSDPDTNSFRKTGFGSKIPDKSKAIEFVSMSIDLSYNKHSKSSSTIFIIKYSERKKAAILSGHIRIVVESTFSYLVVHSYFSSDNFKKKEHVFCLPNYEAQLGSS